MRQITRLWCGAVLLGLLTAGPALAETPHIAQVKTAAGPAFIVRGTERLPAKPGDMLYASDVVETGAGGDIGFTFVDNTDVLGWPQSKVRSTDYT